MPLQRSVSAPQPLAALLTVHLPHTMSLQRVEEDARQLERVARLRTPRLLEKEDPFNLGGFFPSSLNDMGGEWGWLRDEDGQKGHLVSITGDNGVTADALLPDTLPPAIFGQADDDIMTRKSIKGKDNLGAIAEMLSFSGLDNGEDGRLLSPYSDDEAVDLESLHLALCSRRQKHGRATKMETMSYGELFLRDD